MSTLLLAVTLIAAQPEKEVKVPQPPPPKEETAKEPDKPRVFYPDGNIPKPKRGYLDQYGGRDWEHEA